MSKTLAKNCNIAEDILVAERTRRKDRLAAACRIFARFGFEQGAAGHLSIRDPEHEHLFWLNPFGRALRLMHAVDLLLVDQHGRVEAGQGCVNPAAVTIHGQIYLHRRDVMAVVHAHSMYGKTWASLHRPLDPINQDACAFFQDHVVFAQFDGIIDEPSEGEDVAEALGSSKAVILANHGLLTVGASIDSAAWWFIAMDRCCQSQLLAEAVAKPKLISAEIALRTKTFVGAELAAKRNFQMLYEDLINAETIS